MSPADAIDAAAHAARGELALANTGGWATGDAGILAVGAAGLVQLTAWVSRGEELPLEQALTDTH